MTSFDGDLYALGNYPTPTVSISPASVTLDVVQSKLFTATASGGSGSYSSLAKSIILR